jgi:hypothetical protein
LSDERRLFLGGIGLMLAGAWLTRCSLIPQQPVSEPTLSDSEIQKLLAEGSERFGIPGPMCMD